MATLQVAPDANTSRGMDMPATVRSPTAKYVDSASLVNWERALRGDIAWQRPSAEHSADHDQGQLVSPWGRRPALAMEFLRHQLKKLKR